MNVFAAFQTRLEAVLLLLKEQGRLPASVEPSRAVIEPPRDPSHGDMAINAAMVFAKEAGMKPRDLAALIVAELEKDSSIVACEIAGPGFINIRLAPSVFDDALRALIADPQHFGRGAPRKGKVNVEYVSANPTGPMHVGHGRGAVFGDALASLLAFAGHDVTREYYINDAGAQVDVLARSVFLRYREALGEDIGAIPDGFYPGDYLKPVGVALVKHYATQLVDMPESEWLPRVRRYAIDAMMTMIREDLAKLRVEHSVFFSEASLREPLDAVKTTISALRAKGLVYDGRLPPPKGQVDAEWEDREQALFRSTEFGDDVDRPLVKSDGSYTYFASDIAYHASKYQRGFTTLIDVWGADHGGYVKRMAAAVNAVSDGKAVLDVKLCQLVKLMRNGEPVKMSKRSGDFVTLAEVVDEVGADAVRFMMLFRKNDAPLEFDLAKVIEQSKDNAVFYVQYAHARCFSIFRQAAQAFDGRRFTPSELLAADFDKLSDPDERRLIQFIAEYPRVIDAAAQAHEPHRLAFYLYDLASAFHALWNRGKDKGQAPLRFINQDDATLTVARLALVYSLMSVLASALAILGVSAPDEMR
ncbi:MAG: arginine--tRNA ligase [Beijerinckiaceae bacterium]|nr:arginine--tRNA ligase [Beijerinckiaceae bacterium]